MTYYASRGTLNSTHSLTSWMGDCLWTGGPYRYATNHLGWLSLSSLRGR